MNALGASSDLDEMDLDVLGQQLRINRLYTQTMLCFELPNESTSLQSQISATLNRGIKRLSASFPWIAGKVVNLHGIFKIQSSQKTLPLVVKDYRNDPSLPSWEALQEADFPFRMLDENLIAPCKTLAVSDSELPVFLVQANFITGGLLLTFNGQHGSMDMAGQGQVMYLLAKACRNESFTPLELSVGNMDRRSVIPVLNDYCPQLEPDQQNQQDIPHGGAQPAQAQAPLSNPIWAYFVFSASSLTTLKSLATTTVPPGSFISTDDALSAFTWQSITRARLPRLANPSALTSTLSRNVDMRRYLSIPATYPGLITDSTTNTSTIDTLVKEPLGSVTSQLRSALESPTLRHATCLKATILTRGEDIAKTSFAVTSVPELDVRLSSWANGNCYDLDFGFGHGIGKPKAVRRPRFVEGAREGLVYFMPRTREGEIAVGMYLRDEDLGRLKHDGEFGAIARFVG